MPARRQLARILREGRKKTSITQEAAAAAINMSPGTLFKLENAKGGQLNPVLAERLCQIYGIDDAATLEAVERLCAAIKVKGPYQPYRDVLTGEFDMYLGLEGDASELVSYENEFIPGLLQTERYARALAELPGTGQPRDEAEIEKRVTLRMTRQSVLRRKPDPLTLDVILGEAVLRRAIGGEDAMAEQLRHVNEVSQLPNVTIRVAPFSTQAHLGLNTGPFVVLRFPGEEPPIAYTDGFLGDSYFQDWREIRRFEDAFTDISKHALDQHESQALIEQAAKELTGDG